MNNAGSLVCHAVWSVFRDSTYIMLDHLCVMPSDQYSETVIHNAGSLIIMLLGIYVTRIVQLRFIYMAGDGASKNQTLLLLCHTICLSLGCPFISGGLVNLGEEGSFSGGIVGSSPSSWSSSGRSSSISAGLRLPSISWNPVAVELTVRTLTMLLCLAINHSTHEPHTLW